MQEIVKKINFRGVFAGVFLLALSANATDLSCDSVVGNSSGPTPLCSINVKINKADGTASGRWNGQADVTKINSEDDNLAEFYFDGADAGIWERVNEEGVASWVGFVVPAESDAACRVKCVEMNANLSAAN